MKDQLVFDVNSADTIADSDSIGAFLRAGDDGTRITHIGFEADDHDQPSSVDFVDGDVTVGDDSIAESSHGYNTGDKGQLTTTGTLPAGLSLATDYYIIKVDNDNFKLASSLANAVAGSAVDITAAAGGGTHTFTVSTAYKQLLDVSLARLEQIEDSAHASGDRGIMPLAVRNDSEGSLVSADGDYAPLQVDSSGRLRVVGDIDITNLSEKDEDAAHSSGDTGDFVLSIRMDDVDGSNSALLAGTEGDYQGFFTNAKGELHVRDNDAVDLLTTIDTDTGVIAGDTTSMDATLTALSKAEDAAHSSGDQGIQALAVRNDTLAALADTDGDYAPLQVDANGALYVNASASDDALANTSLANTATNVDNTAGGTDLVGTDLANRKYAFIYNNGNRRVFIGASGVTAASGFPLGVRSVLELRAGASIDLHAIAPSAANQDIRILELS